MLSMILKMSALTLAYIVISYLLWETLRDRKPGIGEKIAVGFIFGLCSIFSTHFGVDYEHMILNVRDLGPMCAGLFFDPVSGIVAGIMGGIERYIAGTYWGVGSYTRIACSVSTCLAGFLSAFLYRYIFKGKKPSPVYAFFMGAVIEVFHMYVVFVTHRDDMAMAFVVVRACSLPMILFSATGLALTSLVIMIKSEGADTVFRRHSPEEVPLSRKFQVWLFAVTAVVLALNFWFNYSNMTSAAMQNGSADLELAGSEISENYELVMRPGGDTEVLHSNVGRNGSFAIADPEGKLFFTTQEDRSQARDMLSILGSRKGGGGTEGTPFIGTIGSESSLCSIRSLSDGSGLILEIPMSEIFDLRDVQTYETVLADILIFTVIYVLISLLVQTIVVDNLQLVNASLNKITQGDLDEEVSVYKYSEFTSLSHDINQMVSALKGYIAAAEKRIEQELLLAHTIQDSALPKNFDFNNKAFEIYALMDPAKEVGGDFYDFFFVDNEKLALVIADVAGKGIPASLFMMRSKTAIRSLAETGSSLGEVFTKVNEQLCKGNEADMFVTVWMAVIDLNTGLVKYINAGHEYPELRSNGQAFSLYKDRHGLPLGVMEDISYEEHEIQIQPGDEIFVYTDGVPEAINTADEQYGTGRLTEALNRTSANSPVKVMLEVVRLDLDEFVGEADQFDDVTMLGFRFNGTGGGDQA